MKEINTASAGGKTAKRISGINMPPRYVAYFLLLTILVTATSLSRFATTSPNSSDPSRVAGFNVTVVETKGDGEDWECFVDACEDCANNNGHDQSIIDIEGSQKYQFTVENGSEVAVRARLVIECCKPIDEKCDDVTVDPPIWWDGDEWVYFDIGANKEFEVTVAGYLNDGHDVIMNVVCEQVD